MTDDKDAMDKAADKFISDANRCCESCGDAAINCRYAFDRGWLACLHGPAVLALVEVLRTISLGYEESDDCRCCDFGQLTGERHSLECEFRLAKEALAEFEKLREASK